MARAAEIKFPDAATVHNILDWSQLVTGLHQLHLDLMGSLDELFLTEPIENP